MRGEVKRLQAEVAFLREALTRLFTHIHVDGAIAYRQPEQMGAGIGTLMHRTYNSDVYF